MALEQVRNFLHESTYAQSAAFKSGDKYYSAAYELENFMNATTTEDSSGYHPFDLMNDPTLSGFKIYWHFDAKSGLFADESYTNSALAYLKRIGDTRRYVLLKNFIMIFQRISIRSMWIFKSLSGMDEMFNAPMQGQLRNHEIEIKTFETIDLKIQRIIMMYRDIVLDQSRGVWVLPVNLRQFSCSIYVYDNRVFSASSSIAQSYLRTVVKYDENGIAYSGSDPDNLAHVLFDCGKCEFSIGASGKDFFSDVSNNKSEFVDNNITFTVKKVRTSDLLLTIDENITRELLEAGINSKTIMANSTTAAFAALKPYSVEAKQYNKLLKSLRQQVTKNALVEKIANSYDSLTAENGWSTSVGKVKSMGSSAVEKIGNNLTRSLVDSAMSSVTKLYLGNVYGFGPDDLAIIARTNDPSAVLNAKKIVESTTQSLGNSTKYKNLGNIND